jgi:hypothetical protein
MTEMARLLPFRLKQASSCDNFNSETRLGGLLDANF